MVQVPSGSPQGLDASGLLRLKDGGGIHSTADWYLPKGVDLLAELRSQFLDLVCEWQLLPRLRSHVAQASREPLLNEDEVQCVKYRLADFLTSKRFPCKVEVPPGQPLTLDLWRALLLFYDDIDMKLPCILREGVPRGILADVLPSGVWRAVDKPERPEGVELEILEEPWGSALEDPDCLMRLVQADVEAGFADWIPGGVEEARRIFGANCAAGKLGLVKKAGSEPRLVGDSSISCANQLSRIREKIELPSLFDIEQFVCLVGGW